jgi:hypothetical protein
MQLDCLMQLLQEVAHMHDNKEGWSQLAALLHALLYALHDGTVCR